MIRSYMIDKRTNEMSVIRKNHLNKKSDVLLYFIGTQTDTNFSYKFYTRNITSYIKNAHIHKWTMIYDDEKAMHNAITQLKKWNYIQNIERGVYKLTPKGAAYCRYNFNNYDFYDLTNKFNIDVVYKEELEEVDCFTDNSSDYEDSDDELESFANQIADEFKIDIQMGIESAKNESKNAECAKPAECIELTLYDLDVLTIIKNRVTDFKTFINDINSINKLIKIGCISENGINCIPVRCN